MRSPQAKRSLTPAPPLPQVEEGTQLRVSAPARCSMPRTLEAVGLVILLAVAACLRLGWVGVHSFGYDEARIALLALEMAQGGQFAAVGMPSSAGIPNPPGFVWLMSMALALSPDPLVASLLIGAVNVLAVLGLWYLARQAWGPWAALAAGLLLATSPLAVFYSRSIWSQDLLAPMAVLWALAGVGGVRHENGPLLALHLFLAGFAWQVHYSGAVLLPASAWLVVRYRLWRRWPWLLAGAASALLAITPFALALLREGGAPLQGLVALSPAAWRPNEEALLRWVEVGIGANWSWLPLGSEWRWPPALGLAQRIAQGLTGVLMALGLSGVIAHAWRTRPAPQGEAEILANLLPAWALATPLIFTLSPGPVHHQYQLAALPALLLAAAAPAALGPVRWHWRGPLVAALALVVAIPQGLAAGISLQANRSQLQPGGMGTPLAYPRAAASALQDGTPIRVHTASDDPAYDADAAAMSVLLWDYPHQLVNGSTSLLLPPEGERVYLWLPFADLPALEMAHRYAHIESTWELPRRQGEPPYIALRVIGGAPKDLPPSQPVALENGATFIGWEARWEQESLVLVTCWRIGNNLLPGRYHQFNHLYTPDGEAPLAVQDAPTSSGAWNAGDILITWATFQPEELGPYFFEVGMYHYPSLARVPIRGDGAASNGAIRLGPAP